MLKKALIVIVGLIAALVLVIALQPSQYVVTRSTTVNAAPGVVFPYLNDLKKWEVWSPWAKLDPQMTSTYEGPAAGVGAIHRWKGNDQVGEGSMTITEVKADERVRYRLDFIAPMPGTSAAEFTVAQTDDKTTVTWTMSGDNDFIGKAFCLFMNMDRMIGGQFEQGLANLKRVVETPAKP